MVVLRRRHFWASAALVLLVFASSTGPQVDSVLAQAPSASQPPAIDPAILNAYRWRGIGPNRGGRSIAVSGVKGRPREAYFGAVGGGLWKTVDAGNTWAPVTDGQITSSSVGAVAVSESNPDVLYIGMGESCIRGNIMPGDGVYKSADAGRTWTKIGFTKSDAISKIRIHPTNHDIVYVASFGLYSGPSDERGVFKSIDGGKTWKRVLFRDTKTGAVDIAIDRKNPNVLYASLWEAYRVEYQMSSGGPGSGLFKSSDGGETWTEITRNQGLPAGMVGRIGIAVSGGDANRVYALVENENGGLFASDDAGATWRLINGARSVRQRAFYYTHVFADPNNKDTVYMQNTALFRSTDGGKTIVSIGNGTHGDHHDLWIDPDDSEHVMDGNDGGGAITYNVSSRQRTWTDQDFPTAQFYHVTTTAHLPFHVCGAQQDNSTMCVASNSGQGGGFGGVPPAEPYQAGGGEPGYIAADRTDPDVYFAGANNGSFLTRLNRRTGALKEVGAYPRFFSGETSQEVKERWQWTYPIIFSYVDPKVLYTSSQRIWKSTNGGDTWDAISGDLSRHDPKTMQESGGPITHDMNSPEIYATVFSLAPGKKDINVMWAGSDDGLVHVTRDHGKTWTNVTPPDMPDLGRVSQLDGSSFDNGTAYMAVKKMLLGDVSPYIFRTRDYGRTWTKIVNGIAANDYVHVVREDNVRKGLLYAGTQHGAYISFDDGERWMPFKNGLPDTPVSDLWVEKNALAIATHGRSFYVMDNLATLRQYGAAPPTTDTFLFSPPTIIRGLDRATLDYYLKAAPKTLILQIIDAKGQVVRSFTGQPPRTGAATDAGGGDDDFPRGPATTVPMVAGLNRASWDLNSTPVMSFQGMILWGATQNGPMVLPGTYQVKLTVDSTSFTQPLTITKHPLRNVSDEDLMAQWDLASRIRDKVNEANLAVIRIRRIKTDVAERIKDAPAEVRAAGDALTKALVSVEEDLYQVRNQSGQDPLNFPIKTNNRLASLLRVTLAGEGRPTGNVEPIFNDLVQELKAETDRLDKALSDQLPALNRMLQRIKRTPIGDK
jgi:photosystem II stability/assembly factor-like uncharacterized protein